MPKYCVAAASLYADNIVQQVVTAETWQEALHKAFPLSLPKEVFSSLSSSSTLHDYQMVALEDHEMLFNVLSLDEIQED